MEYLVVLLLFVVFVQTRVMELRRSVLALMAQSVIVACACLLAGLNHGLMHALIPFALTLGVKVIFIPTAMLKLIRRITDEREIFSDINVNYSTMAAAAFLVFGYVLGNRFMLDPMQQDIFAATIMMIMTGLALMVMRKRAILQICGLITLENSPTGSRLLFSFTAPISRISKGSSRTSPCFPSALWFHSRSNTM